MELPKRHKIQKLLIGRDMMFFRLSLSRVILLYQFAKVPDIDGSQAKGQLVKESHNTNTSPIPPYGPPTVKNKEKIFPIKGD